MNMLRHTGWTNIPHPHEVEGPKMGTVAIATIATAGLAAATIALARAVSAAPTDVGTAQEAVNSLQAQGFRVIVHKVGSALLDQCSISAVRPGQTCTRTSSDVIGSPDGGVSLRHGRVDGNGRATEHVAGFPNYILRSRIAVNC
jgi:hypothetical protein